MLKALTIIIGLGIGLVGGLLLGDGAIPLALALLVALIVLLLIYENTGTSQAR